MALKQLYYQVISTNNYEACLWGVYIDPATLTEVMASAGSVAADAILVGGLVSTTPPLDNPPSSVLYIPANTSDPQQAHNAKTLYREGLEGLTPADQAKQANVSFNINPGQLVGVDLTFEKRFGFEIVHVDLQPRFRQFDLGRVK